MIYLIDSDWVADYLKGRHHAVALLTGLTIQGAAISVITFGEIYEGIYFGIDAERHECEFMRFLSEFEILFLDRDVMKRFAGIRRNLRRSGQMISDTDLLIAATALHYDLTLVSRNRRHFERIPNLKLLSEPMDQSTH